jgi:Fe-S cluster assembly protein SufD
MNVAVLKTKAEQGFSEAFAGVADELPGGEGVARLRRDAIGRFETLGLPHRRIEEWKYTDLRSGLKEAMAPAVGEPGAIDAADLDAALGALATIDATRIVIADGLFSAALSDAGNVEGLAVAALAQVLGSASDAADVLRLDGRDDDAMLALNAAYVTDGAVIGIAKGAKLAKPLLIVHVRAAAKPQLLTTRNVISVGDGAEADIIEAYVALPGAAKEAQHNAATEIGVGEGARVGHLKCTLETPRAMHIASWVVDIGAKASYRGFHLTTGTALVRNGVFALFKGEEAKLDISGVFLERGSEHVDSTLLIDHAVPRCESRELFKGVLEDTARGIFQGKVIVRPDAQKTDGKQMAQVLMLSPDAEFDSKPELEIYADDVVCGHGSTSADIDEDLLFYCQSRGIPEAEARGLLIESFIGEAIEKVEHEGAREALQVIARQWLQEGNALKRS